MRQSSGQSAAPSIRSSPSRARAKRQLVRADLEDADVLLPEARRVAEDQPRDRARVVPERGLGLEGDVAADRGVVVGVDLALAEPVCHLPDSMFRAADTTWAVVKG